MTDKGLIETKWRIIGGVIIAIIGFVTWYYQVNHDSSKGSQEEVVQIVEAEKTEIEEYREIADDVIDLGGEIAQGIKENKQQKDSIYEAEREKRWVFQIGNIVDSEDAILELYQQLKGIEGLSVFKESRKSYFLFVDGGKSKQELKDSSEEMELQVEKVTSRVRIIDIVTKCNKRKKIKKRDDLNFKKEKVKIDCYECGKS